MKHTYAIKGDEIADFVGKGELPEGYTEISELDYTLARLINKYGAKAIGDSIRRLLKLLPFNS